MLKKKKETIVFAVIIAVLVAAIVLIFCFAKGCKGSASEEQGGNKTTQSDKEDKDKDKEDEDDTTDNNAEGGLHVSEDPKDTNGDTIDASDIFGGSTDGNGTGNTVDGDKNSSETSTGNDNQTGSNDEPGNAGNTNQTGSEDEPDVSEDPDTNWGRFF